MCTHTLSLLLFHTSSLTKSHARCRVSDILFHNDGIRRTIYLLPQRGSSFLIKQQAYKPGSVPRYFTQCLPFILAACHHAALCGLPLGSDGQPSNADIHNLTTHKTYGGTCHHPHPWALTPPFHPYRRSAAAAVIFCYATLPSRTASR